MNNGVTICLNTLRSIMEFLTPASLRVLDDDDLIDRLKPYAMSLGGFFARMTTDEKQRFRQLQGSDGQIAGAKMCQEC